MACLRYLARREHSQAELRQKLVRAGYPDALVIDVIVEFERKGYQSDRRYAEVLSGHRARQGYGPLRIRAELRQKGVAEGDVSPLAQEESAAALESAYTRKYGGSPPDSLSERANRERYLLRRGFSGDAIRQFFRRLRDARTGD